MTSYLMSALISALSMTLAAPLFADPMSAEAFDAYTRDKTLFYSQNGQRYGAEVYRENRRVTWSFLDGECKDGYWYNDGPTICFVYEDQQANPQCWTFELGNNGLIASFVGAGDADILYEAQNADEEMLCLGPKVGV
ncbi:MAG: hypothetical protein HRU30_07660 [Rhodobacteraceae bacterium]|nr:hypothetical protein [Paracoccaceae bacterium]